MLQLLELMWFIEFCIILTKTRTVPYKQELRFRVEVQVCRCETSSSSSAVRWLRDLQ